MRFGFFLRATARVIKDTNATRFRAGSKSAIVMTPEAVTRIKQLLAEQPQMTALKVCFYRLVEFQNMFFRLASRSVAATVLHTHWIMQIKRSDSTKK
jgi:hypothetical protein